MPSLTLYVAASADDAEELETGVMDLDSTDLDLSAYTFWVAIRVLSATIPPGSTIDAAFARFTSKSTRSGASPQHTIFGEDADDAAIFTSGANNITNRTRTTASVTWTPGAWAAGNQYDTPSLVSIVQEIVNRGGWSSGNALALIIQCNTVAGTEKREADSFDHGSGEPEMHITYTDPSVAVLRRRIEGC